MESQAMEMMKHALKPILLAATLTAHAGEPVDINTADAKTLASVLVGIGETKARAIVDYRDAHGRFQTIDDLALVQGIGEATVARNREKIRVE